MSTERKKTDWNTYRKFLKQYHPGIVSKINYHISKQNSGKPYDIDSMEDASSGSGSIDKGFTWSETSEQSIWNRVLMYQDPAGFYEHHGIKRPPIMYYEDSLPKTKPGPRVEDPNTFLEDMSWDQYKKFLINHHPRIVVRLNKILLDKSLSYSIGNFASVPSPHKFFYGGTIEGEDVWNAVLIDRNPAAFYGDSDKCGPTNPSKPTPTKKAFKEDEFTVTEGPTTDKIITPPITIIPTITRKKSTRLISDVQKPKSVI